MPVLSVFVLVAAIAPVSAQGVPPEIAELRQRVTTIRAEMAQVTASAEYAATVFTRDTSARFLISSARNAGLHADFAFHSGGSPDTRDAEDPASRGIVLLPVSAWETSGFAVAALVERWRAAGRPVIVIGSSAGKPEPISLPHLVPNGAPDGSRARAPINEAANLIAAWTLYVEFVGAATRRGWQPGILASILVPNADDSNSKVHFHTAGLRPVEPIPAGQLGTQYLDRIDSLLNVAAKPRHQALMQRAADSLRAVRAAGHRLFVGACGNYLQRGVLADSIGAPFQPVLAQYEIAAPMLERGAHPGDAVLWFGYDGYDCPHLQAASPLQDAGFKVVVVGDSLPSTFPSNVMVAVPLGWSLPENIGRVTFNAEGVGSASSVDALVHYLWLKRLVGAP